MKEYEFKKFLKKLTIDFILNYAKIFKSDVCDTHCFLGFFDNNSNQVCIKHAGRTENIENIQNWLDNVKEEYTQINKESK